MTIPFIYYAQRHKFAWTFAFSQWMKIHKFFLPTTRIFELERILTSFEKVEESRRSKRKKKKLDKVKESKKNRLDGDKSFIIWSCGVARLEKTSRQQATSPKLRAGFLVHLIFRLLSDLTGVGVLLTIFWVAPLGLTEWHISRTSHTSNLQFWYVLVPFFVFFFYFLWFHSRFILESHAFGIQGGMPAMRATGTCRETHTWGEDGSTNTVSCKNKKGEKGAKRPFPLWPKRYMARVSWLSMLYGAKPKRWKINASFLSKIVESEQFRELICNLTISKIFLAQRCAVSIYVITLDTESEIIWIIFR